MDKAHERRFELLIAAVLVTLWGGWGLLGERSGYTDSLYEPDYTIREAVTGTVLEEAGFQPGDSVVAVEGIPVEELGMYSRWPRSLARRPGETLQMTVVRDGQRIEGTVTYREVPPGVTMTRWVGALVAWAFLWLGMWVLFTTPSAHAGRLALIGLLMGLTVLGPSLGSLNGFRDHFQLAAEILALVVLFQFFLLFPKAKRPARSPWIGLIYVPWLALILCLVAELVTHPRLYNSFGGFIGILFLGYLVATLVAIGHTALTSSRGRLRESGIGFVVIGWLVALVPNLVAVAGWVIPPGWSTPGQSWFPLLIVAVPVGIALGVWREARGEATGS